MLIEVRTLKRLIRESFYDEWFVEKLPGVVGHAAPGLFSKMGSMIGHGNERVVYSFSNDAVIKFMPTYERGDPDAEKALQVIRDSDIDVLDSGVINTVLDGEPLTFAVWYVMPRYKRLSSDVQDEIDDVVSHRVSIDSVADEKLRAFLAWYVTLPHDLAGDNVMMDEAGDYVISDV